MASVIAAVGFFVIPAKRKKGKEEMRQKIAEVRQRLGDALRAQFKKEISRATERIRTSIAPYSRFVRSEGEKLDSTSPSQSLQARRRSQIHAAVPTGESQRA